MTSIRDKYTAMDRGLVNGYTEALDPFVRTGMAEVTTHMIEPGFYTSTTVSILNEDKYQKLPAHLQKVLDESINELVPWLINTYPPIQEEDYNEVTSLVTVVKFTGADAELWRSIWVDSQWDKMAAKDPEGAAKVRAFVAPK